MKSILILSVLAGMAQAQWTPTSGPAGKRMTSLIVKGTELYAGAEGGIFRSGDDGRTWTATNELNTAETMVLSGNTLLAGTRAGVRRLADGETTWKGSSKGITESFRVVLAGLGPFVFAGGDWGIYRSADQGLNWVRSSAGLNDTIACVLADADKVFAGAMNGTVYQSNDSGATWTTVGTKVDGARSLERSGGRLFVRTRQGVLRLSEDGTSWSPVFPLLPMDEIIGFFRNGSALYVVNNHGLHRSLDLGETWIRISNFFGEWFRATSLVAKGESLFMGTDNGIFRSSDSGLTWVSLNRGIGVSVFVHFASQGEQLIYAGYEGLFRSKDQGEGWWRTDSASGKIQIASMAESGGFLYGGNFRGGVLRSSDSGATWAATGPGLPAKDVSIVYSHGSNIFVATDDYGLYRSIDQGATWQPARNGLPSTARWARAFASAGNYLFLGTSDGVFRSSNSGTSWGTTGLSQDVNQTTCMTAMGNVVFIGLAGGIGVGGGLYRSRNLGSTWERVDKGGIQDSIIISMTTYGSSIFASSGNGLYRSSDSGTTWVSIKEGLSDVDMRISAMTVHGASLYISYNGVWKRPLADFGPLGLRPQGRAVRPLGAGAGRGIRIAFPRSSGIGTDLYDSNGRRIPAIPKSPAKRTRENSAIQ